MLALGCDHGGYPLMKEVIKYFKDNMDITGMSDEEILEASEVFPLPDGRFMIVEG